MNLLFDFGGVLADLDKQRCIEAFSEIGFDVAPCLGTYRQAGVFEHLEDGTISVHDFCNEIRRMANRPQLTDAQIANAWEQYLTGVPQERLEMLLRLARHHDLYVLSNTNEIHWQQAVRNFFSYRGIGVEGFFKKVFLSYEMHVQKPDPEIFRRVAHDIGCSPQDILFFDDSEVNCAAARSCGFHALPAPAGSAWFSYFDSEGRLTPQTLQSL